MIQKYKRKLPKYATGIKDIGASQWGAMNNVAQGAGAYVDSLSTDTTGRQTELGGVASGALKGAGFGMALAPLTGGLSVPIGAGLGMIGGYFGAKNKNKNVQTSEDAQAKLEAEALAERQKQEQQLAAQQQLNYSRSYYGANPASGQMGSSIYAYGTKALPNTPIMAEGGSFTPVSSNVAVVNGKTHAQGGVDLVSNGKPIAEVEKDETIINGKSVASDRLVLPNGKSIAEESIRIGKGLAKVEKNLNSTNTLKFNSANRVTDNLNKELASIIDYQEQLKNTKGIEDGKVMAMGGALPKYFRGTDNIHPQGRFGAEDRTTANYNSLLEKLKPTPYGYDPAEEDVVIPEEELNAATQYSDKVIPRDYPNDGFSRDRIGESRKEDISNTKNISNNKFNYAGIPNAVTNGFNAAAPYLDNAANLKLISKAPQVATPNMEKLVMAQAMPMKTTYNINPQLNMSTKAYKDYMKNVDDNTSNSAVSRGNKLAAFSKTLENKSNLQGQKENIENQLINQDTQNRQQVSNYNAQNAQNISNRNLAKMDAYQSKKEARLDDNRRELSKNVANLASDAKTNLYDTDRKRVYHEQMLYDALSKRNGAAVSELIGSDYMNSFVGDEKNYKMLEQNLKDQPLYLKKFYETYGKR